MEIKVFVDIKTRLGEVPTWDPIRQRLFWVDIVDGRLFCCDEQGGNLKAWETFQKIGSYAGNFGAHSVQHFAQLL